MSFHRFDNLVLYWVSTASLVTPCVPAARRLPSSSSLSQIAQNGEPIGLLLEEDLVKTARSVFFFCCFFNWSTFCLLYLLVDLWWNTALWCSNVILKSGDSLLDQINKWWSQLTLTFSLSMSHIVFKLPAKVSRSFSEPRNNPAYILNNFIWCLLHYFSLHNSFPFKSLLRLQQLSSFWSPCKLKLSKRNRIERIGTLRWEWDHCHDKENPAVLHIGVWEREKRRLNNEILNISYST